MKTTWIVFGVVIVGLLAVSRGRLLAQGGYKGSIDLNAQVTSTNPKPPQVLLANPSIEHWSSEWHGAAKQGNWIHFKGVIKNIGNAATPATLIYKVEMREGLPAGGPIGASHPTWISLGSWQGDALKPNQSFVLERNVSRSSMPVFTTLRLTVLSTHKVPNSQDFFRFTERTVTLKTLVPDLGVSALSSSGLGVSGLSSSPKNSFVAQIKNYGHPQAVVRYTGGRSWKLYVKTGAKWEYITGAPIDSLVPGQVKTIDLLAALSAARPPQSPLAASILANLPETFNQVGRAWKLELTGSDANAGNDFRQLFFTGR